MLSDDEQQRVTSALRLGLQRGQACSIAGVTAQRLGALLQAAEDGDATARQLLEGWERAEATCAAQLIDGVRAAVASRERGTWRAAIALLERRFPETWTKPTATARDSVPLAAVADLARRFAEILNEATDDPERRTLARRALAAEVEKLHERRSA